LDKKILILAISSVIILGAFTSIQLADATIGLKEIFSGVPNFIIKTIPDCDCDPPTGWSPPSQFSVITDPDVNADSFISIMILNSEHAGCSVFRGNFEGAPLNENQFGVECIGNAVDDGAELRYMIVNPLNNIVGGLLLQPNDISLFLAYGIANSFWMAPLAIGVGAGVYLTRTKWKKKIE
jgi:hypothetical protein